MVSLIGRTGSHHRMFNSPSRRAGARTLRPGRQKFKRIIVLTSPLFLALFHTTTVAQLPQPDSPVLKSATIAPPDIHCSIDSSSWQSDAPISPAVYYFYEPFPMEPGASVFQVGGSFSLLPVPDAEQELPIPAVDVQYKRGVFDQVVIVGSLSTCIFSTLVHAGIQWNTRLGGFTCGVANHVGVAYGFMTRENSFDNVRGYGVVEMLILRLGYRLDDFSFSSSFVGTYMLKSQSYVNGQAASIGPQHTINDLYCTIAVEQPFLRSLRLSIGLSLGYARTPYQTWMLYNTIDEWLFTPEFFFAVQL